VGIQGCTSKTEMSVDIHVRYRSLSTGYQEGIYRFRDKFLDITIENDPSIIVLDVLHPGRIPGNGFFFMGADSADTILIRKLLLSAFDHYLSQCDNHYST